MKRKEIEPMNQSKQLFWGALVFVVLMGACESTTSTTELETSDPATPVGSWSLRAFDLAGGQTVLVPTPERYQLDLGENGDAHVRADCNFCNGSYRSTGTTLEMGLLACTLAACPPGSLDGEYLRALGSASSFAVTEEELSVAYPDGVLRFGPT
jgi:heat shock protein HslJ